MNTRSLSLIVAMLLATLALLGPVPSGAAQSPVDDPPPPCPDDTAPTDYEPDDTAAQAHAFPVGSTELHAFCTDTDVDWVSFEATAGIAYEIFADGALEHGVDTTLELYQSDGRTLIARDYDIADWPDSRIMFPAPTSGRYYVKVINESGGGSPEHTYKLRIAATDCKVSSVTWQNAPIDPQSGTFTFSFDATPNDYPHLNGMNGVIGLSAKAVAGYTDLGPIVRFNPSGYIDARNGSTYQAETEIPYNPELPHRFRLVIRIPSHTYDIFVYAYDSSGELPLGTNFAFRTEQRSVTRLANWAIQASDGVHWACNLSVTNASANLLQNASFELDANGDSRPDSWSTNRRFTRGSAVKYSGGYVGRHRATDNGSYLSQQTVAVKAGNTYRFAGWVNIPATSDTFRFKLIVLWKNSSGAVMSTSTIKTYTTATGGWTLATASRAAPTGTTAATVRMDVSSLNATVYVDDFLFARE